MQHENSSPEPVIDNGSLPPPGAPASQPELARPEKTFPSHLVRKEVETPKGLEYARQEGGAATIVPSSNPLYVTPLTGLGEDPTWIDCPFCRERTMTRVSKESSNMTNMAGVVCCLLTCIGACIPCLCGWCEDVDHYCTKCNRKVTHQPHDGPIQVMGTATTGPQPSVYAMANQGASPPPQYGTSNSPGKPQGP